MSIANLFLDTNIIVDYIIPYRQKQFPCSVKIIEEIKNGNFEAWTVDYALSETLGNLKSEKEKQMGTIKTWRETISKYDMMKMVAIIDKIKKIPHLTIFNPKPIPQSDIFDKVQNVCVQATDALILLSILELSKKIKNVTLITRDDRLRVRGGKIVPTAHPIDFLKSCPRPCSTSYTCSKRKS